MLTARRRRRYVRIVMRLSVYVCLALAQIFRLFFVCLALVDLCARAQPMGGCCRFDCCLHQQFKVINMFAEIYVACVCVCVFPRVCAHELYNNSLAT